MFSPTKQQAFLLLALDISRRPRSEQDLAILAGTPQSAIRNVLEPLRQTGKVRQSISAHSQEVLWEADPLPPREAEDLSLLVRRSVPQGDITRYMGYLHEGCSLDECEYVLKGLDDSYNAWTPGMGLYVELAIRFLLEWGVRHKDDSGSESWKYINLVLVVQSLSLFSQRLIRFSLSLSPLAEAIAEASGNEQIKPFINIQQLYMELFLGYPQEDALGNIAQELERVQNINEPALSKLIPALVGAFSFIRGEFQKTIECYRLCLERPHWWYRRLFEGMALNTLFAATYLKLYHFAMGISESAQKTTALSGDTTVSLFYLAQHCFLLLRKRDTEKALEGINRLLLSSQYSSNYVLNSLCVRLLALHHYLEGNIKSSYHLFNREIGQAAAMGLEVSPFYDPLILDMLYVFEQEGYPPVSGHELDKLTKTLIHSASTHLKGAALRIQALRERDQGAPPDTVLDLLYQSLKSLLFSADTREIALTEYEFANTFDLAGQHDQAERLRNELFKATGQKLDVSVGYRLASVLCLNASKDIVAHVSRSQLLKAHFQSNSPQLGREIIAHCHKSFHDFPVQEQLGDMYYALVKIALTELRAEQAALFSSDDKGEIRHERSVNLTSIELGSEQMSHCLKWIREMVREKYCSSCIHQQFGLCLLLDIGRAYSWAIYLNNTFTEGLFRKLTHFEIQDIARLFAAELRSCLRIESVRDKEISNQCARFKTIVSSQEDNEMRLIIGDGLNDIMQGARRVSATDIPILLWGETGVGKEVMARQVHQLSECPGPFIAVHPASMPETLFESEFFGYERGAFTGAAKQKIGLFELADQGTLFIDEIGEISPLIQTKLLRVLQERRFMRVGGTQEIYSHFRLVAATNRDLWQEVREGRFREDLLYRISVVPLKIPALRERRQDIMPLAAAFIDYFSRRYGKTPHPLTEAQQRLLYEYDWPGNIRELKNVLERAVILCEQGGVMHFDFPTTRKQQTQNTDNPVNDIFASLPTVDKLEEHYLRYVMEQTQGHVLGDKGAAALLNMKQTTLYAKLRKYGIRPTRKNNP